jgi:hypothetical protein
MDSGGGFDNRIGGASGGRIHLDGGLAVNDLNAFDEADRV